jgi:hypothetical protein
MGEVRMEDPEVKAHEELFCKAMEARDWKTVRRMMNDSLASLQKAQKALSADIRFARSLGPEGWNKIFGRRPEDRKT